LVNRTRAGSSVDLSFAVKLHSSEYKWYYSRLSHCHVLQAHTNSAIQVWTTLIL